MLCGKFQLSVRYLFAFYVIDNYHRFMINIKNICDFYSIQKALGLLWRSL